MRRVGPFVTRSPREGRAADAWGAEELTRIITEENLKSEETHAFVEAAFRDGAIPTTGTAITRILPPVSRFSPSGGHAVKKQAVIDRLLAFFDRYFGLA